MESGEAPGMVCVLSRWLRGNSLPADGWPFVQLYTWGGDRHLSQLSFGVEEERKTRVKRIHLAVRVKWSSCSGVIILEGRPMRGGGRRVPGCMIILAEGVEGFPHQNFKSPIIYMWRWGIFKNRIYLQSHRKIHFFYSLKTKVIKNYPWASLNDFNPFIGFTLVYKLVMYRYQFF